ncbi:hypothetical protein SAMN05216205_5741 [Pseudomonas mohnii]|uniref:Uncharacterized protein n=1 Tax=Pseudomonas mohnii TaxID=395600 RepID=A0ABY0YJ14_9PSED|nr:hypothetical protein [Pseudomonas mohnii]SED62308.1 hypothetical protein SAMN05216205_5741 [Pseudomonas mohnii]
MSVNTTGKHSPSATILIETRQITSNLEKANGQLGLRCFISTAWDLLHDCPIDQRVSYDGTLAKATIRSPEMLSKSSTDATGRSSQCHLKRCYGYLGIPYEVCVIHNGCVWLRPIGPRRLAANVGSYDARPSKQDLERQATASAYVRVEPVKGQRLRKSRASFAQQPSEIQRLVGYYFESLYCVAGATKSELARRMQAEIQAMNLSRPGDQQLNIPALKTLCLFMDEYYFFALSNGRAAKRTIVKLFAGISSKPFDRQPIHTAEQSPPELKQ